MLYSGFLRFGFRHINFINKTTVGIDNIASQISLIRLFFSNFASDRRREFLFSKIISILTHSAGFGGRARHII